MRKLALVAISILAAGSSASRLAFADSVNAFAGSNIGSNESGLVVLEYVTPYIIELGPFAEFSRNTGIPENRFAAGLTARSTLPWLGFFVDARMGWGWSSTPSTEAGGNGFDLEFGGGYRFSLAHFDLLPRLGIRAVTGPSDIPAFNLSVGVAIPL